MVSTHAWKAAVASPPATQPSSSSSPFLRSPFGASNANSGVGASLGGAGGLGGMGGVGFGASSTTTAAGSSSSRPFIGGGESHQKPGGATGGGGSASRDFESLLANSASLLSSMGRAGSVQGAAGTGSGTYAASGTAFGSTSAPSQRALGDKSLLELNVASASDAPRAATYEAEASAHRLFAREGFDSARLGRHARELERRANVDASSAPGGEGRMEEEKKDDREGAAGGGAAGGGVGLEGHPLADLTGASIQQILASHHDYCVRTSLRQAREWTASQAQKRVEERIKSDWEAERREILGRGVLGNRFLLGVGGGARAAGPGAEGGVASRVPMLEGDSLAGGAASPFGDIVPSPQIMPGDAEVLIKSHLAAVDKHLTAQSSDATKFIASLQDGIRDAANSGLSPESLSGYSNALSLLQSTINCNASLGVDPSSNADNATVAAAGAMGACNFFARQFASHARETVRDAELAGMHPTSRVNNSLVSGMARDVCAYASIAAGDVAEGRGGVWPKLFYCLRCGDLIAAGSVLQQFGNTGGGSEDSVDPSVSNLVSQLAQLQQTQETIFGDSTNGNARPAQQLSTSLLYPSQLMVQARRSVADLYERTKTRSGAEEPHQHYRTACLAMLGGPESISEASALESSGMVATVEDYLYASLWHALCLADGASSAVGGATGGGVGMGGGTGLRGAAEAVARLSVLVDRWGPSYFERDETLGGGGAADAVADAAGRRDEKLPPSGGLAFALPLLASQQRATALAYLAEAGGGPGLLQAAHLGGAMDLAGLPVEDFALEGGADANRSKSEQQRRLLPLLLASYSASLQGVDAGAALKYLVLLSDRGNFAREQVQRLLLETRQFSTLAGEIQPDGSRSAAALDAHFSKREVSALLVDAAHRAMRAGKPADAAELLVLSGRFGALFELMNRELASYLNAATPEDLEKRRFWFDAANRFHAVHLAPGRTYVQTALDGDGSLSLGNTFQLLMNLVVFFDRCRDRQWEGAWVLMDNLQLFPRTESEMTVKAEAFRSLDGCVRRAFHHVVLAAMEALCHLFREAKQGGGPSGDAGRHDATGQRLDELRARARLLVTFARLLNLPSLGGGDTYVRISQLEKNMM